MNITDLRGFLPNSRFRKTYAKLFEIDPPTANLLLLMAELAGSEGNIILTEEPEARYRELVSLMEIRFSDPLGWQL